MENITIATLLIVKIEALLRPSNAEDIDLVVSDLVMPEVGGLELYEALNAGQGHTKVLLTSGYPGREAGQSSELDPSLPFIGKPWKTGDLLRRVREVLDDT